MKVFPVLAILLSAATPETMTKMVVRLMGPGIKPGSYAALPKTIYRAGAKFARLDDAPDARQQMQKTTIIAEPDAYSVNLISHTGTHAIDRGGENDLHLPIVLQFDPNHKLGKLDRIEFGAELEFFEQAGAIKAAGPIINAKPTDLYELTMPWGKTQLITRETAGTPVFFSWTTKEGTFRYEYTTYQADVAFDASIFAKPNGIKYKEIPPPTEAELAK
jgi:hypothetical protein